MTDKTLLELPQAAFQQPEHLSDVDSWHGLIPIAFAMVTLQRPETFVELGVHKGDSYAAFCQAMAAFAEPGRAYAVDTWQGDEHAGFYGDEILADLKEWHDPRFGNFSRLVRSTFDEAVEQFADGSIDLLHIDGLHTYEAVRHDFETWLPKMSARGVALFHDFNVRERDFGVWQLWDELASQYPARMFPFSHGLGVLAVGTEVPDQLREWFETSEEEWSWLVERMHMLGEAVRLRGQSQRQAHRIEALEQEVAGGTDYLTKIQGEKDSLSSQLKQLESERDGLDQKVRSLHEQFLQERDSLSTQLREIQAERERLAAEVGTLGERAESSDRQLAEERTARQASDERAREFEQEIARRADRLERIEQERDRLSGQVVESERARDAISAEMGALRRYAEGRIEELKHLAEERTETLERIRNELQHAKAMADGKDQQVKDVWNSTSWRLTAPIRKVSDLARAVVRGIGRVAFSVAKFAFWSAPMPARTKRRLRERIRGGTVEPTQSSVATVAPTTEFSSEDPKADYRQHYRDRLERFLESGETLSFASHKKPRVSVVLILYNQAELTFACLESLAELTTSGLEVIIWDNASSDKTMDLLGRLHGPKVLLSDENLHFLRGCNRAVEHAEGEYTVFLNNDAQLPPATIDTALRVFDEEPDVGAVGGRVVLLDGQLQEAGSIVWADGSCMGYGRGEGPSDPPYMFRRDVDFCSGVFLVTPTELFRAHGCFDESFAPAYYEESDYCMRLWEQGKRVVYEPGAVVMHHEFGSSGHETASDLMRRNQTVFQEKHANALRRDHFPPALENILHARSRRNGTGRLLFIDDKFPHLDIGQGFPRANMIVSILLELGYEVTVYATNQESEEWSDVYRDLSGRVECLRGTPEAGLRNLFTSRGHYYDVVYVSRPHNMEAFRGILHEMPDLQESVRVIYDAEALFSTREILKREIDGRPLSSERREAMIREEMQLANVADGVVTVSEKEREHFRTRIDNEVGVVGHVVAPQTGERCFRDRRDFLFIGAMPNDDNPNADSIRWFIRNVWPKVREILGDGQARFRIAGLNEASTVRQLESADVDILGPVADLEAIYDQARVVVIPTRYAAGVPYKAHEAAGYGVPIVTTSLIADQLGWSDGKELMAADVDDPAGFAERCVRVYTDPTLWATLQQVSCERVKNDCSRASIVRVLHALLCKDSG